MKVNFTKIREKLDAVEQEIRNGSYRTVCRTEAEGWGGAGIVFTMRKPKKATGPQFYPDPKYVVTPHANEAGWLLNRLRDVFSGAGLIDSCSKIEFFGRLANAALRYQKNAKQRETCTLLLAAMLAESKVMLAEMEKGEFQCLIVAPGGVIADDLKKRK